MFGAHDVAFAFADVGVSAVVHQTTETTGILRTERVFEPDLGGMMTEVERPVLLVRPGTLSGIVDGEELTVDGVLFIARSSPTPLVDDAYCRIRLVRA